MAIDLKLNLKLSQNLVMTPQLQQAIKLLQLNRMELQEVINQELVDNPLLEELMDSNDGSQEVTLESKEAESPNSSEMMQPEGQDKIVEGKDEFDWAEYVENFTSSPPLPSTKNVPDELPNYENMVSNSADLISHLRDQIQMTDMTDEERILAEHILGNLDRDGYFTGSIEEIATQLEFDLEDAEEVLKMIQRLDPVGVAARDLKECLLVQAEVLKIKNSLVLCIINDHLPDLEKRNLQAVVKATGALKEEVVNATKELLELDPKPGRQYADGSDTHYITPDIYVSKVGDEYTILLNEDGLPKLRVSGYYKKLMQEAKANVLDKKSSGGETKDYIQEKLRSAVWLIKSIHNRQKTIYRVMESIVRHQRDFFEKGVHHLRPMVLREVANDIGVHESTISRVTTNKYCYTPVGIFELKYFFNSGIATTGASGHDDIASESVKAKIRDLISHEDQRRPLSDQKLVEHLRADGIDIARRTVAKYREGMGILSSQRRKKLL